MKKLYTALCAAILGAGMAGAAGLQVTFNGSDNANWTADGTAEVSGGHLNVTMAENNGKYRADVHMKNGEYSLDATADRYVAVKFIGERPNGNMTLEIDNGGSWMKNDAGKDAWVGKPQGSVMTKGGNTIYYYDLTRSPQFTSSVNVTKINFKIADCTVAPYTYSIDWVKTYATPEAIEADKDWADDGAGDIDEAIVAAEPVVNETTGTGYTSLEEALLQVSNGDVILINKNQTLPNSRIGISRPEGVEEFAITIKGNAEGVSIIRGRNDLNMLINANAKVTFENLAFSGNGMTPEKNFMEVSGGAQTTFRNVTFSGFNTPGNYAIQAKNNGKVHLEGVQTVNSDIRATLFVGSAGSSITGDNSASIYLEKENSINASELTNTTPVALLFDTTRENKILVNNWDAAANFTSAVAGYAIVAAEEGGLTFEIRESGVESVSVENATVSVYSIGGVLLRRNVAAEEAYDGLPAGLYIINGKKYLVK